MLGEATLYRHHTDSRAVWLLLAEPEPNVPSTKLILTTKMVPLTKLGLPRWTGPLTSQSPPKPAKSRKLRPARPPLRLSWTCLAKARLHLRFSLMPHPFLIARMHLGLPQLPHPFLIARMHLRLPLVTQSLLTARFHLRIWNLLVPQSLLAARINLRIWILLVPMSHRISTICTNL